MWICSNCGRENKDNYLNCMDCAHIEPDHIRNSTFQETQNLHLNHGSDISYLPIHLK